MKNSFVVYYGLCFVLSALFFALDYFLNRKQYHHFNQTYTAPVWGGIAFAVLLGAVTVMPQILSQNEPFTYLVVFLGTALLCALFFRAPLDDVIRMAICPTLVLVATKGIVMGITSLVISRNMYQITIVTEWSQLVTAITCGVSIGIMTVFYFIADEEDNKALIMSPGPKHRLTIMEIMLLLFLMFFSYNYYYNVEIVWFSVAQILMCVIVLFLWLAQNWSTITFAALMQRDMRKEMAASRNRQHESTLVLRKQLTEQLNSFRHDYSEMMVSLDYLCENGTKEQIKEYMDSVKSSMNHSLPEMKRYSNNDSIDALLYETSGIAKTNNTQFEALVYTPSKLNMSFEDLRGCLSRLIDNAVDATSKMKKEEKRFIHISSNWNANWLTIVVENSYAGRVRVKNNVVMVDETNLEFRGQGLNEVRVSVEKAGGMLNIDTDTQNHIFKVSLHLYGE